jgi:hypothetical protein
MASFSVNSWITASLAGPSKHCSVVVTTFSSSSPQPSISANSLASLILYRLEPLSDLHDSDLNGVDLLLGSALLLGLLHPFNS